MKNKGEATHLKETNSMMMMKSLTIENKGIKLIQSNNKLLVAILTMHQTKKCKHPIINLLILNPSLIASIPFSNQRQCSLVTDQAIIITISNNRNIKSQYLQLQDLPMHPQLIKSNPYMETIITVSLKVQVSLSQVIHSSTEINQLSKPLLITQSNTKCLITMGIRKVHLDLEDLKRDNRNNKAILKTIF